jgi:hypothetical protein
MPAGSKTISIDKYVLYHTACGNAAVNWISCFVGGSRVGQITFHPKDQVTKSVVFPSPFSFSLCYEITRYQDIIETFRYEKPVYVFLSWDENNVITTGYVTTSQEPVGEQEGVPL